jgi:hypothetical protein
MNGFGLFKGFMDGNGQYNYGALMDPLLRYFLVGRDPDLRITDTRKIWRVMVGRVIGAMECAYEEVNTLVGELGLREDPTRVSLSLYVRNAKLNLIRFTRALFPCLVLPSSSSSSSSSSSLEAEEEGEITALRLLAREMERDENNMFPIRAFIARSGYEIRSVPGDGNCGIYALLQALEPEKDYSRVRRDDPHWQAAVQLRQALELGGMVTNPHDIRGQLGFDALPAVGEYFSSRGRRLVVINSTPDRGHSMYSYYGPGEGEEGRYGMQEAGSFEEALKRAGEAPLVLLYRMGHWDAVTFNPDWVPDGSGEEEREEEEDGEEERGEEGTGEED